MGLWGGRSELSALQRIGHALRDKRDRVFGGFQVRYAGETSRNGPAEYFFHKVAEKTRNTPETPQDARNQAQNRPNSAAGFEVEEEQNPAETPTKPPAQDHAVSDTECGVSGVLDELSTEADCRTCRLTVPTEEVALYPETPGEVICNRCYDPQ